MIWLLVLAGAVTAAVTSEGPVNTRATIPGIESQDAFDLLAERFPDTPSDSASATLVFVAPDGGQLETPANQAAIEAVLATAAESPQVSRVVPPSAGTSINADGSNGFASVSYEVPSAEVTDESRALLEEAVEQARDGGLTAEMRGSALKSPTKMSATELIGVAVAALVLLLTFGSLVAAGLPLLTAIIGVAISFLGVWAVAGPLGMAITSGMLALMLGLAVGIDYAMFVVSRYQEERLTHDAETAAGRAVGTAGSAVVFAGTTVVIALAGLAVVGIPSLMKMGLAAAGAVVVAVLVALTLVPALLGMFPNRVRSRSQRRGTRTSPRVPVARGWMRLVRRRPLLVTIAGVAVLVAVAVPALSLQLGTPGDASLPTTDTERRAYDPRAEAFGPGSNGPLTVVVDARAAADPETAVASVADEIAATDGVASVSTPTFNAQGDTAILTAVPTTGPTDERTEALVNTLRDARPAVERDQGVSYEITGTTALDIDMAQKTQSALATYALVVGLAVLLLLVVFCSIWVPIKAAWPWRLRRARRGDNGDRGQRCAVPGRRGGVPRQGSGVSPVIRTGHRESAVRPGCGADLRGLPAATRPAGRRRPQRPATRRRRRGR
ncbi:MMPL family transporter [Modestobacter roseus]|uniref:MMPL family transporter n=2 Tax=Modestobacter roseus TaxID=1181884 RepID=UPI001412821F|nr:MMPL family transporter [Modestobacter roseus]